MSVLKHCPSWLGPDSSTLPCYEASPGLVGCTNKMVICISRFSQQWTSTYMEM